MDLNKLIPDRQRHNRDWSVGKQYLLYKNIHNIPVCYIENDIVWIFLDLRIQRQIIDLIKHVQNLKVKFYFTHPDFSNPGELFDLERILLHYFRSYADAKFYKSINKIDYDLINNLVNFTKEFSDFETLKSSFYQVQKEVNRNWFDYFLQKNIWDYPEHIREEFRTLWREIQINNIL